MKQYLLSTLLLFTAYTLFAQHAPVAANDTFTITVNQQVTLPVLANDYDIDGDPLTITILPGTPLHGSASVQGTTIQYQTAFNYTGTDSIAYSLCDNTGLCDTATVYLIIPTVNGPVALNDTFAISKNQAVTLPVLSNDYDPAGDPLTISLVTLPPHGMATVNASVVDYSPTLNYIGTDFFYYAVCNPAQFCDTALVNIIILPHNTAPVAVEDSFSIEAGHASLLPVLSNDADAEGDPLNVSVLNNPQHGTATVNSNNQVNYLPSSGFIGTDSFTYVVCDTGALCDTATVLVVVTGNATPPVAVNDHYHYPYTDSINGALLPVLANDYDTTGSPFSIVSVFDADSNANHIRLNFDSISQQVRLSLAFDYTCGIDSFYYVICNPVYACDTAVITVAIDCPPGLPGIQGFSPNGDGINDLLVFEGISNFSPVNLKVFNRYGAIVYQSGDYQNNWDGTLTDTGHPLPSGTYFYTLQYRSIRSSNYLVIER